MSQYLYDQGKKNAQSNPNTQMATEQQIRDYTARQNYNTGVADGRKK